MKLLENRLCKDHIAVKLLIFAQDYKIIGFVRYQTREHLIVFV